MAKAPPTPRYLLDSSVLIQAHRAYYRFAVCQGFWDSVLWHHAMGTLRSIDKVFDEISVGKDALAHWAKNTCPKGLFESSAKTAIGTEYGNLIAWANAKAQYNAAALSEFATVADTWLIAFAKVNGYVVVTQEEPAPASITSIKIPDVCDGNGVAWMNTYDMLEKLGVNMHWKSP